MTNEQIQRIRGLIDESGISTNALEKTLGMSGSTISRWDTFEARFSHMNSIAQHFNVSLDYLACRTDDPRFVKQEYQSATYKIIEAVERLDLSEYEVEPIISIINTLHESLHKLAPTEVKSPNPALNDIENQ